MFEHWKISTITKFGDFIEITVKPDVGMANWGSVNHYLLFFKGNFIGSEYDYALHNQGTPKINRIHAEKLWKKLRLHLQFEYIKEGLLHYTTDHPLIRPFHIHS